MDIPFDVIGYQPTRVPAPGRPNRPPEDLPAIFTDLRTHTREILKYPYHPANWTNRASVLAKLQYPELVVGDAFKAALLCRSHLHGLNTKGGEWRLGHNMGFWMQDPRPRSERETDVEAMKQILRRLQGQAEDVAKGELYFGERMEVDEGWLVRRMYPWMRARHQVRGEDVVERVNEEFGENAEGGCEVKRDAFGTGKEDVLGVFAKMRFRRGEVVLVDETEVWGRSLPKGLRAENVILRRPGRDDEFIDLRWIVDQVGPEPGPVLLNARLLLCAINEGVDHPLDHHLISRLTPTYHRDKVENFVVRDDIAIPNAALQTFGIDIFANLNWDTWILFTIQARILNNSCGDPSGESLNPLFALFNHSCEPNVQWTTRADNRTIVVTAKRDIQAGEQLLVEYDQYLSDKPLRARRERIWKWLDALCQCSRCVREEKEGIDHPREEIQEKAWDDISEKAVFPEDLLKN